jgi:Flp pilus assembly protein TadB
MQNDYDPNDPAAAKQRRPGPFGIQRRHYVAIRIVAALGIVLVGVTLHHHGPAYDAIRGVYLVLIVALVVWRIRARRERRHR